METETLVCLGCGAAGTGPTPKEAWGRIFHEGKWHREERMTVEEALAAGRALTA